MTTDNAQQKQLVELKTAVEQLNRRWFKLAVIGAASAIGVLIVFGVGVVTIPRTIKTEVESRLPPRIIEEIESNQRRAKTAADSATKDAKKIRDSVLPQLDAEITAFRDKKLTVDDKGNLVRVVTGSTTPGATQWELTDDEKPYGHMQVVIDTSHANFREMPKYFVTLVANRRASGVTSAGIVYSNKDGFVFTAHSPWGSVSALTDKDGTTYEKSTEVANGNNWHIVWMAIERVNE